ncbi:MAG: two-component regulator propeller domain-containing protein [Cyclobacteriaceae bacterium]
MKINLLLAFVLVVNLCFGQTGNYFISHYTPDDERFDYFTFAMSQDDRGVIYFANKRGVLEFDGRNWGLISTPGPVFTVTTIGHDVYAGGYHGFGKVIIGSDNAKSYQSLSQNQKNSDQIFSSLSLNGKIYFANAKTVFIVSTNGNVEATIGAKPNEEFNGLLNIAGKIYARTLNAFYRIDNNKLEDPAFPWTDRLSIDFAATSTSANPMTVLSVGGGRLFLASTSGLKEITLANRDFLIHNVPVAISWLNDQLIAVGTLHGGVIFIDPQTGATQEITNFYTGLPDNEVYSLFADRNQGLWVAHGYGFSRITPFIPLKSYSHYSGLEGNLLCAKTYQGQTYVGTTLGLFCLVKQEITEEVQSEQTVLSKESKTKRGLFSFLRRNTASNQVPTASTKRVLKSIGFVYKRVEGISGKVTQLLETDNQLLAIGDFGISSVTNTKSVKITSQPIRTAFKSKALEQLLVSTLDDELKSFCQTPRVGRKLNFSIHCKIM